MVIFDCERLKHPHTGLYHYTHQLAHALAGEAHNLQGEELRFYVHDRNRGLLDGAIKTKDIGKFDRGILFDPRVKLWHISSQLSHYQPLNGKKVLTIHDLNYLYERLTAKERRKFVSFVKKNLRRCTAVVAISEFTRNDILSHLDLDIPIEVIYNGCNRYQGLIAEPADKPRGEFIFAVGNVVAKKNFHVLPALLRNNDYELVIAGDYTDSNYAEYVKAEAKRHGVADRVKLPGAVSDAEKHWYLSNCAAFVHPSIAEGFGLPVIEAMQYGKPVFISDHTSLPEIGGDLAYYFNHEFDADGMIDEFTRGMADFASGGKRPEDIIRHAESFSWTEAARRHIDLYNRILAK